MRPHKPSLVRHFVGWLTLALVLVGVVLGTTNELLLRRSMEQELTRLAQSICEPLANILARDVWELDERSIAAYLDAHAASNPNIARIRILTEFDDPICTREFVANVEAITVRHPVYHEQACVGFIELALRREHLLQAQQTVAKISLALTLCGIAASLLVTTILMRGVLAKPLRHLVRGVRQIAAGDYTHRLPAGRHVEIDSINAEVNLMASQIAERTDQLRTEIQERLRAQRELEALKDALEAQVAERTQALQEAYEALRHETRERQQVQAELLAASTREQRRIGHDLHDSLGQQLAGLSFLVGSLARQLQAQQAPEAGTVQEIGEQLRGAIAQTRQIARGLSPVDVSEEGLVDALHELAHDVGELFGMTCEFTHTPRARVRDSAVAVHLYHITQEALHNSRTHGQARHVWIHLNAHATGGQLTIRDSGHGMAPHASGGPGMGLRIMRHRAASIGGELQIQHNELGGVTVSVTYQDPPPAEGNGIPVRQTA